VEFHVVVVNPYNHNSRAGRTVPCSSNLDCICSVSITISVHDTQCRRPVPCHDVPCVWKKVGPPRWRTFSIDRLLDEILVFRTGATVCLISFLFALILRELSILKIYFRLRKLLFLPLSLPSQQSFIYPLTWSQFQGCFRVSQSCPKFFLAH
jgi:hypothetical protein